MNSSADAALATLLAELVSADYRFVTITPASHARVLARPDRKEARDIRDVLGWSLPFRSGLLPRVETLLAQAGLLERDGALLRSRIRVSSVHDTLFIHSAYPTTEPDAVFFGPDSYRFVALIADELAARPLAGGAHVVDFGAGSGVGGIMTALALQSARITLVETNGQAQRFARINASVAGVPVEIRDDLCGKADLVIINPPYIADPLGRSYRDGGALHGGEAALAMVREAADHLAPGGRIILYTGAAVVEGRNPLWEALATLADTAGLGRRCREIDPDVFGEELANAHYAEVDRIALIAAVFERPASAG